MRRWVEEEVVLGMKEHVGRVGNHASVKSNSVKFIAGHHTPFDAKVSIFGANILALKAIGLRMGTCVGQRE